MDKLFKTLSILAAIPLLIAACGAWVVQAEPAGNVTTASYPVVLGKSLNDQEVVNFIASNDCSPAHQFQLCKDAGMALWTDSDQIVKTVYMYSGNADGFRRYRGELPFGLSFYDPMWRVEDKLRGLEADETSQPPWRAGLPDEASSPDHMHYWAVYKRFGMTVIYNSPSADEDAYIYAILVSK